MLESKPNTLSPVTPQSMENGHGFQGYGLWEPEILNPLPHKVESTDILDLIEPNITSTIHHLGRDCPFPNSHYLTPLPMGDPYCSPDSHYVDNISHEGSINSAFHKFSDVQNSTFHDNYDSFLPDLSQSYHNGLIHGHIPLQFTESSIHSSTHPEYNWDDVIPCDQDYFIRKPDYHLSSEIDSEELDSKSSGESHSTLTDSSYTTPPKRKVGRPPKKDKKLKRNEKKTGRLWEFIRDLLKNPEYCPSLVKWENAEEGLFRFVNSEKVAQLWGNIKGNPRMTYEKLSRAMRYYYKSHVFEPVLGRRLVYKFGHNATNWRPINASFINAPKLYN
ncbi:unnamed protein product [Allacma fusca]|uniref:ETS domain-containing protein n=1 Tax=Allacma fusca TaxID=39272 RepID=A0A8J2PAH2_9HEXA|nr:unnamed protein product [Allacma fusca]